MNPYLMLAVLAVVFVVALALAARLLMGGLRERREALQAARRAGPASDYYARTLRQAAEAVGGEEELASALKVTPETLRPWLRGEEAPPLQVHLAALELVTRGTPETRH